MTARITAAIPVHNGARYLRETIRSLKAQTIDARLIVLDDASTDDSIAVARSESVEVIASETNLGLAANWNRAFDLCTTPYLVIAHQDDVYEPRFLETMLSAISHPNALAAHCRATTIDEHGQPVDDPAGLFKDRFWTDEPQQPTSLGALRQGNFIIAPSAMISMRAAERLGRFDTRYQFVTDWEYWLRGLLARFTIIGVPERLVRFRRHPETATRASERTMLRYEEELELLRELNERVPGADPYRALQRNLLGDFVSRLAAGDRGGAAALLRFGEERVPGFPYASLMRVALAGGRAAGRLLAIARDLYVRNQLLA